MRYGKTGCSTSVARRSSRVPSPPKNREHFACLSACLLPISAADVHPCRAVPKKRSRTRIPYHTHRPSQLAEQRCWHEKSDPTWAAWRPELPVLTSDQGRGARSGDAERAGQASEPMRTRQPGPVCAGQATSMLPPAHGCLAHLGPVAFFFLENMTWTRGPFWKLETHKVDGCTAAGRTESKLPGAGDAVPRAQARHGES